MAASISSRDHRRPDRPISSQAGWSRAATAAGSPRTSSVSSARSSRTTSSSSVSTGSSTSENRSGSGSGVAVTTNSWIDRSTRKPGPGSGVVRSWNARAAALASSSAFSFRTWPACPFTHSKRTRRPCIAWSRAFMISTLATGLPSPFFQPRRFHPGIHLVIALMA